MKNFQAAPQADLLTDSLIPILEKRHPDGKYCIGRKAVIYWRITESPEKGCTVPDWFYVGNVPPLLDGQHRRYYVLLHETLAPFIVLQFVFGDVAEERNATPYEGKFWIYEKAIRIPFYGIYDVFNEKVEIYHWVAGKYEPVLPNDRGHYPIAPLGVEIGIWVGKYQNMESSWLRWWDANANLLLTGSERAELERQEKELAQQEVEKERQRAERLAAQLRALGIEP